MAATTGTGDPTTSALLDQLLQELVSGGRDVRPIRVPRVDPEAIAGSPAARAFRIARQRELERQRASAAERLAAGGLTGSGEFDADVNRLGGEAAESIAAFEAGLTGEEFDRLLRGETARFNAEQAASVEGRNRLLGAAGLESQRLGRATDASSRDISNRLALLRELTSGAGSGAAATNAARQQAFENALTLFNAQNALESGRVDALNTGRQQDFQNQLALFDIVEGRPREQAELDLLREQILSSREGRRTPSAGGGIAFDPRRRTTGFSRLPFAGFSRLPFA